jgi:release factor glutamine methyltransferase
MKVEQWLRSATKKLEAAGIGSARLDALILLEDELGLERSRILAESAMPLSKSKQKRLDTKLRRRQKHLPLAYIRGHTEFYGRKFLVNRHTLEPRPESETMIDVLMMLPLLKNYTFADVGTGSGALGVTAALELSNKNVDLYDIDANALAVAKHNLELHELSLKTYKRDLLRAYSRPYDVILANLPYVPDHYKVNQAAAMEPRIAIFGGKDGLDVYRRFFGQLERFSWSPKFVLTEALPPQHTELAEIAVAHGFTLIKTDDLIQLFRPI